MLQNILTEPNPAFTSICTFDISKLEYVLITYNKSCLQGHSNGFCKHGLIRLKLIWIKELERPGFLRNRYFIRNFSLLCNKKEEDMQSCILKAMLFFMHNSFITDISWRPSTES